MAFADMFAPMRNFGATAAATTQAEAARMGAEASKSRAETAESLAPWNMAATAVQGIGTIGGLTQKFMEMEQMRPQREAMTDYYKAQADRISGPAAKLQATVSALTGLRGQDRVRARKDALEGRSFAMRAAQDEYRLRAGARKAPAPGTGAFPLERYGTPTPGPWQAGLAPTAWDWSEVDPAVREFAEHMADTLPEYLALDDDTAIAEAKSIRDNIRKTTVISSDELRKIAEVAPGAAQKAAAVNQLTNALSALTKSSIPLSSPRIAPIVVDLYNTLAGTPQFNINNLPEGDLKTTLQNMEKTRAASLGGRGLQVSFEEGQKMKSRLGGDLSGAPEGTAGSEVAAARLAPLGSETPRQRDLQGFSEVELEQRVPHGQAGSVAASRLLDSLGNKNPSSETLTATTRLLGGVLRDLPEKLAGLAQDEITYAFDEGSSPEMNRTLSMLTRAAHSVAPEYRDDLWRIIINKAAGELPATAGGREAGLRTGYELKEIGRDAAGEPIYDVPSAEEYVGTPRVDRRTRIVNALEKAKRHFSTVEYDQGPGGVADWLGGGGGGASASEGEAIEGLLREMVSSANRPEGAEIADRLSNSQLRDLLNVGELRGPISGHTQYRKTYKPMWNIAETGYADIDEGRAGPGQYAQEALWWLMGAGLGANALGQFGPTIGAASQALPFLEPVGRGLGITRERYGD